MEFVLRNESYPKQFCSSMFTIHFISTLFTADVNWQVRRCHHSKEHRLDCLDQWNEKIQFQAEYMHTK